MSSDPAGEPAIDISLAHYLEQRALDVALTKAPTPEQTTRIDRLIGLRERLMNARATHHAEVAAKRHARGEIYSNARVASINAMGPSKEKLDDLVERLYVRKRTALAATQHSRWRCGGFNATNWCASAHRPNPCTW